ncbi:hypothetical protein NQ315_017263 [Exocentrus adspersus]|uniref:RRM domain-containing protein n=1 Tax=Exocentrus adspersus TaxID=1586481 RepID=A0AAV8VFA2_9CUCU|nr:hypothetical protein NQ315_017263 [Exocentrus adspersus]
MVGSRVYVGGLPYGTTERDLERFFRGYGRMRDVLIKNGYGFVEFDDYRDADDAVYELNGKKLLGERVTVERARGTPRGRDQWSSSRSDHRSHERYGPPTRTNYRLIVENLSSRISWQDLKDYMRQAGEVTYADAHKQHRNEGVVEFASYSDMKNAIEKLDDTELNDVLGLTAAEADLVADLPDVLGLAAVLGVAPTRKASPGQDLGQAVQKQTETAQANRNLDPDPGPIHARSPLIVLGQTQGRSLLSAPTQGHVPELQTSGLSHVKHPKKDQGPGHVLPVKAEASLEPIIIRMSLLLSLQAKKDNLKPTETIITCIDGRKFKESKESQTEVLRSEYGYVIDTDPDDVPVEIRPFLYLGSQDCCSEETLKKFDITYVLSVGIEAPIKCPEVTYKHVTCLDIPETNLELSLRECIPFIQQAKRQNKKILVHCNAEAYNVVKTARNCIKPNTGFEKQLRSLNI